MSVGQHQLVYLTSKRIYCHNEMLQQVTTKKTNIADIICKTVEARKR